MAIGENNKLVSWDWDLRVRDRHLASGLIDAGDIEQYLSELPDREAQAEYLSLEQPAIGLGATRSPDDRSSDVHEDDGQM